MKSWKPEASKHRERKTMSSTVSANTSSVAARRPRAKAADDSKSAKPGFFAETIKGIIEKSIQIEPLQNEIKELRSKNWSNYQIAHFYVSLCDPQRIPPDKIEKYMKFVPFAGKKIKAIYKTGKKAWQMSDQLMVYSKCIAGIALTYNPSISNTKELYLPIMRTFVYGINRSVAQKISLKEQNTEKIAKQVGIALPQIAIKLGKEFGTDFFSGLAGAMVPAGSGLIKNKFDQSRNQTRSLIDIKNMIDLIEDYEIVCPTPNLESIKKDMIASKVFNHLLAGADAWYNNRIVLFLLALSIVVFPPMLVLLIIALWLNQTRSPGRLWYTDKFLVITNLIFVLPVGLYGVAKGGLFSYGPKWYDNRAYLIFLLIYLLPPVLTSPVALYALIRTKALGITGKIIVLILFSAWLALIFLAPPETPTQ